MPVSPSKDVYTYVLRGAGGVVLYVGASSNPERRMASHRKQPWGRLIESLEIVQSVPVGVDSVKAEKSLISKFKPLFNKNDGGDGKMPSTQGGTREGKGSYLLWAPEKDMRRWKKAALRDGVSFASYVRKALDEYSGGKS